MSVKLGVARIVLLLILFTGKNSFVQAFTPYINSTTTDLEKVNSNKLVHVALKSSRKLYKRLHRNNKNYLKRLTKAEAKIQKKLCLKNDKLSDHLFKFSLTDRLKMRESINNKPAYNAELDSLKMLLVFIKQQQLNSDSSYTNHSGAVAPFREGVSAGNSTKFTNHLNEAEIYTIKAEKELSLYENEKKYLRTRNAELKAACNKYPELNNEMAGFDKSNYYYTAQTEEYKQLLRKDGLINCKDYQDLLKDKDFANFTVKESQIAKTFGNGNLVKPDIIPSSMVNGQGVAIPSDILPATSSIPSNLQTTKDVQAAMTQSLKDMGTDAIKKFESNMDVMHTQMDKLKGFSSIGGYNISNAADIPDFIPNPLKTKLFKDRFTKGFSVQFLQGSNTLPNGLSLSAEAGYKIQVRWIAGIGISTDCRFQHGLSDFDKAKLTAFTEYAVTRAWWLYGDYSKELNVFTAKNESTLYKASLAKTKDYHLVSGIKFKPNYGNKLSYYLLLGYDWTNQNDFDKGIVYRVGFNF